MAAQQNTIALVYDYDQTLSPSYMQNDVLFPEFGIDPEPFWKKCNAMVAEQKWDGELAYMKCLLDQLQMDGVTNERLMELGAGLNFFPGLPELFDALPAAVLGPEHEMAGITVEHCPIRHMLNLESVITYEGTETVHELVVGKELVGVSAF